MRVGKRMMIKHKRKERIIIKVYEIVTEFYNKSKAAKPKW